MIDEVYDLGAVDKNWIPHGWLLFVFAGPLAPKTEQIDILQLHDNLDLSSEEKGKGTYR